VFRRKNSSQLSKFTSITGTFTASQESPPAATAVHATRLRPARHASSTSGRNRKPGQSLAAAPRPSSTPASTGRRRAQA